VLESSGGASKTELSISVDSSVITDTVSEPCNEVSSLEGSTVRRN
jgi:hypothetical protein